MLLRWTALSTAVVAGTLVIAAPSGAVAGVPVPPIEFPSVSLPKVPPAPVQAPSLPQVEPPTALESPAQLESPPQLESVPEPQLAPPTEAAEPRSAPRADSGGVAEAPTGSESGSAPPVSFAADPASADRSVSPGPDRTGLHYRLAADRKLRARVEELSGCLYAVFERGVLLLRAGLGDKKGLSRGQVARRLNASRLDVRGAERRGVRDLQRAASTDGCGNSDHAGGSAFPGGLAIGTLAAVEGAIAGETSMASNDIDGRQHPGGTVDEVAVRGFQESGGARGENGPFQSTASASAEDRDRSMWLLIFLGLALGGLALFGALSTRTGGQAEFRCAFCESKRVATNPTQGSYRCVDCGFSGQLAGTPQSEAGKMNEVSKRS